ncbi:MAG: hypothetical protein AAGK66_01795 [Pseudomonadota bacterium]
MRIIISRLIFLVFDLLFLAWPLTLLIWASTPVAYVGLFFTFTAFTFAIFAWQNQHVRLAIPILVLATGITLTFLIVVRSQLTSDLGTIKELAILFVLGLMAGYFLSHASKKSELF